MTPRILVLYYSQTGQLKSILDNVVKDIQDKAVIDFAVIEPQVPFPFPWTSAQFFDAMPETVERIPLAVKPLPEQVFTTRYDLVILGYQPWFLNPSQPVNGFLNGEGARLLKDQNVVTVVGCRNMWLHGQEKVKEALQTAGARLVGNIVLTDNHPNLISLLTVIRWTIKGQKEKSKYLPEAGVAEKDIYKASRFGLPIYEHLTAHKLETLQQDLLTKGAIKLNPALVLLEQKGIKNFRYWAKYIREKGGPGDANRAPRVKQFKNLLLTAIFVLSPLSALSAFIKVKMNKKKLAKDVSYFRDVTFEKGRI